VKYGIASWMMAAWMWYAGIPIGDEKLGYRICSARFPGPGRPETPTGNPLRPYSA